MTDTQAERATLFETSYRASGLRNPQLVARNDTEGINSAHWADATVCITRHCMTDRRGRVVYTPTRYYREGAQAVSSQPTFTFTKRHTTTPNKALHRNSRCPRTFKVTFYFIPLVALHHCRHRLWVSLIR